MIPINLPESPIRTAITQQSKLLRAGPTALLLLSLALSNNVHANEDSKSDAFVLEEIIVSAQRKEQSVQDVPIAISAFSGDDLESQSITSAQDLQLVTPGLVYGTTSLYSQPYIRGIGTDQTPAGAESSVATFIDGVYQAQLLTANVSLTDLERVEVLKGPQGTLFGRNATGGAISLFTKNPSQERESNISVGYGNENAQEFAAYVSGPLTEKVSANLSATYDKRDGFGVNLANPAIGGSAGQEVNDLDELALRGKVLIEPSENTEILIIGNYSKKEDATAQIFIYPTEFGSIPVPTAFGGTVQTEISQDIYAFFPSATEVDSYNASINISHQFDNWAIRSITSYSDFEGTTQGDFDGADIPVFTFATPNFSESGRGQFGETFTQELQLSRDFDNVALVMGAFYLKDTSGFDPFALVQGGATAQTIETELETDAFAAFAHAIWSLNDKTTITGGIRYSDESKEQTKFRVTAATPMGPFVAVDTRDGEISDDEVTYKFAVDYAVTEEASIYGKYETGFKSGSVNSLAPLAIGGTLIPGSSVPAETLDSYELGFKSRLLDGRMQLNAALFYYDYQNLQVQFVDATSGATNLESASEAEVYGLDLELDALITENFRIRAGMSLLETEYTDFISSGSLTPANSIAPGTPGNASIPNLDLSGNQLTRSPDFTINLGANWSIPIGDSSLDLSANASYSDQFYFDATNRVFQDDLVIVNTSATYQPSNQNWSLSLWAKNLTDEAYFNTISPSALGDSSTVASPRTYGVRLTYRFN